MDLLLFRRWFTEKSTIGELHIAGSNSLMECFSLEDRLRAPGVKVHGATAIPAGKYTLTVTFSQRFQRELPLIGGVPGFEGIRIHSGNTAVDTDGCILVGTSHAPDIVSNSRVAFAALFPQIVAGVAEGPSIIEIVNMSPPAYLIT